MEPLEPLSIEDSLDSYLGQSENFHIYTHAPVTRMIVLFLFVSYLVFFTMFMRAIIQRVQQFESLPSFWSNIEHTPLNQALFYFVGLVGLIIALIFLVYFFWAVIDTWGLQVWVSRAEIRVQNTFTGFKLRRWMGTGSMRMQDITELRGTVWMTYLIAGDHKIRFTPVDQLDGLIATILTNAPDAKIMEN